MKVKDLINKLSKLDGEKNIYLFIDEYDLFEPNSVYESEEGDVVIYSDTSAE